MNSKNQICPNTTTMEDKKLRLGLDSTSVENAFERINKKAQEAFISMNDQIKKSDVSLKQLLASMERQISLMEKESTEDWQRDRKKWEKYLDSHPDSGKAKARISEIDERRREESKVVDELRKIQATLIENSRKEILEDRKNINLFIKQGVPNGKKNPYEEKREKEYPEWGSSYSINLQ